MIVFDQAPAKRGRALRNAEFLHEIPVYPRKKSLHIAQKG